MKIKQIQHIGTALLISAALIMLLHSLAIFGHPLGKNISQLIYSLFLSVPLIILIGMAMTLFPNFFVIRKAALCKILACIIILLSAAGFLAYQERDSLSYRIARCRIFSIQPVKIEDNTAYYTFEQLEELAFQFIPVRLTDNTLDGMPHPSNEAVFVDSWAERLNGRYFPTHFIHFTLTIKINEPVRPILFRLDLSEIEGSPLVITPPSIKMIGERFIFDEGFSFGEYRSGESRPLKSMSPRATI